MAKQVWYLEGYKLDQDYESEDNYELNYYKPIVVHIPESAYKYVGCGVDSDGHLILVLVLEDGYDQKALDDVITLTIAACFEIAQWGVPAGWRCWVCAPRPVDRERARKHRRQSALAIEGVKPRRKRYASVNVQSVGEDERMNIDEPWTLLFHTRRRGTVFVGKLSTGAAFLRYRTLPSLQGHPLDNALVVSAYVPQSGRASTFA
ncbi:hypothetical protein BJY52DRAFT_1219783 [Lactarius psammicola]|nr:hypothetical protein BJY52DRAFT_1219783 [Lactarius psammicola]